MSVRTGLFAWARWASCLWRRRQALSARLALVVGAVGWGVLWVARQAEGQVGTVTLKDGTQYAGVLDRVGGMVLVDDGLRLIVFGHRSMQDVREGADYEREESFRIPQVVQGRSSIFQVVNLESLVGAEPFDEFGRRTVRFLDARRGEVRLIQAITEINPRYARVEGMNYVWEGAVATESLPQPVVLSLLHRAIDPKNFLDRLRVVRFLVQVGWVALADQELGKVAQEFLQETEALARARELLGELKARRFLDEVVRRRRAGQHQLVFHLLEEPLPEQAPGEVVVEVRRIREEYRKQLEELDRVRSEVGALVAQLEPHKRSLVTPIVRELSEQAALASLPRFRVFLDSLADARFSAEAKLALALSGWLVGPGYAQPDLLRVQRLWEARRLLAQYVLSTSVAERQQLLQQLREFEGLTPEVARELLRYMPPPLAPRHPVEAGRIARIRVGQDSSGELSYEVLLPPEYHPEGRYPLLVTLHSAVTTPAMQIEWWALQATRNGYIVLAPYYLSDPSGEYRFSVAEHLAVVQAIRDAQFRFSIDSNRIYLSGHGIGGDAAWDIGLGHPDLFAGVIPIGGRPRRFTRFYRDNARHLPLYVVDGQLDGVGPQLNRSAVEHMARAGYDVRYVEYRGRGREHFSDALLELMDWMGRKVRVAYPREFSCRTGRLCDGPFYCVTVEALLSTLENDPLLVEEGTEIKTAVISAQWFREPNSLFATLNGPTKAFVWLSPDMLDFSRKITLRINGRAVNTANLNPDLEALLEYYRQTGDRERWFFYRVPFERF